MHKKLFLGLLVFVLLVGGAYAYSGGGLLQGAFGGKMKGGQDLAVTSITEEDGILEIVVQNKGQLLAPDITAAGYTYVYIDDLTTPEWKYAWKDLYDQAFLHRKSSSTLEVEGLDEGKSYEVKACVDATSVLTESDETNNCLTVTLSPDFSLVGSYSFSDPYARFDSLSVQGSYAYVVGGGGSTEHQLDILNLSTISTPTVVGTYKTTLGNPLALQVKSKYAYLAEISQGDDPSTKSGLEVVDISTASAPKLVGTYETAGSATGVYVTDSYVYLSNEDTLDILDVSSPSTPKLVGSYTIRGSGGDVYVEGSYAYLNVTHATSASEMEVVDISTPAAPKLIGTYKIAASESAIYVGGNYAYLAKDSADGLEVVDISNPKTPRLMGSYEVEGSTDILVEGDYAYIACQSGLKMIDISDPSSPTLVKEYPGTVYSDEGEELPSSPYFGMGVFLDTRYVYLLGAESLEILQGGLE